MNVSTTALGSLLFHPLPARLVKHLIPSQVVERSRAGTVAADAALHDFYSVGQGWWSQPVRRSLTAGLVLDVFAYNFMAVSCLMGWKTKRSVGGIKPATRFRMHRNLAIWCTKCRGF